MINAISDEVFHTFTALNDALHAARTDAEASSGYTRAEINLFVDQWIYEEQKDTVCNFTVPKELLNLFICRGMMLKYYNEHPEVHPHVVWYRRPPDTITV